MPKKDEENTSEKGEHLKKVGFEQCNTLFVNLEYMHISPKPHIIYLTKAKAYAIWRAVKFSKNVGIQNIILEGNVLEMVHALYGQLIEDVKTIVKSLRSQYGGTPKGKRHTKRKANMAAHCITKAAIQQSPKQMCIKGFPVFIIAKLDTLS